jgi:hypothetical protein
MNFPEQILDRLLAQRTSMNAEDTSAIPGFRAVVDTQIERLQELSQIAMFVNQVPGTVAPGLADPVTPRVSGTAAQMGVMMAQFNIQSTKANLESSRDAFMKQSKERQEQQAEITKAIAEMTQLDLTNTSLKRRVLGSN